MRKTKRSFSHLFSAKGKRICRKINLELTHKIKKTYTLYKDKRDGYTDEKGIQYGDNN